MGEDERWDADDSGASSPTAEWIAKEFGQRVRAIRTRAGLTQAEVAQAMADLMFPIHQTTVAKIEGGARPTSVAELIALSRVLHVGPSQLVDVWRADTLSALMAAEARARLRDAQAELAKAKNEERVATYASMHAEARVEELSQLVDRLAAELASFEAYEEADHGKHPEAR